jgi:hypothetical protein
MSFDGIRVIASWRNDGAHADLDLHCDRCRWMYTWDADVGPSYAQPLLAEVIMVAEAHVCSSESVVPDA